MQAFGRLEVLTSVFYGATVLILYSDKGAGMSSKQIATTAVKAGINNDSQYGAVVPPLYLSTTYRFAGFEQPRQHDYSRCGNPSRDILADALAELEQGAHGIITSTGTAAVHLATLLLSAEDRLLVPHDCYGGSHRLFVNLAAKGHFKLDVVDQHDPKALAEALAKRPKMVWLETPSNPLLRVIDIQAISQQAKQVGAWVVVDNTFLTPVLQTPLTLGADIVVHSTTKYINGHSDVVGGALISADAELGEQLAWWANCVGITGSAFDSYLTLRGLRTLKARMDQHQQSAAQVVEFLQQSQQISRIYYPGIVQHPGHHVASKQQQGFGGMLSFELAGGKAQVKAFVEALQLFTLAESLGGVESLIAHPASMTHAAMDEQAQRQAGITPSLLRLSVGLEDVGDLIEDLQNGLNAAFSVGCP